MYKPLPKELTVKQSSINGLGLFVMTDLDKGHEFGISHIKDDRFENGYIRTPLGGFINHSATPNCFKKEDERFAKGFSRKKKSLSYSCR